MLCEMYATRKMEAPSKLLLYTVLPKIADAGQGRWEDC